MATTTPNYGWDVPTSTDYVKDGATAIETLGDDIDATLFSVTGGKNVGLQLLSTTALSGVGSTTLTGVFSSAYTNYKFIVTGTSTSTGSVMLFTIGGNVASEYKYAEMQVNSGGSAPANGSFNNGTTSGRLGVLSNNNSYAEIDVYSPFASGFTSWKSFSNRTDATLTMYSYFGHVANTASYTSISLLYGSPITGTLQVYGYGR